MNAWYPTAHCIYATLHQRRGNVMMLHRRWYDVVPTSFAAGYGACKQIIWNLSLCLAHMHLAHFCTEQLFGKYPLSLQSATASSVIEKPDSSHISPGLSASVNYFPDLTCLLKSADIIRKYFSYLWNICINSGAIAEEHQN